MTIRNGQNLTWLLFFGGVLRPCDPDPDPELYERWASGCWRRKADGDCVTARREEAVVDEEEASRLKAAWVCCCCRRRLEACPRQVVLRISWRQAWRPEAVAAIVTVPRPLHSIDLHDDAG
jgi:hypothetical protein